MTQVLVLNTCSLWIFQNINKHLLGNILLLCINLDVINYCVLLINDLWKDINYKGVVKMSLVVLFIKEYYIGIS